MGNIDYMLKNNPNTIGASFVITKKNIMELPEIITWCNLKNIRFSYHILENMGWRDWDKDLKPISVEDDTQYITTVKKYLEEQKLNIKIGKDYYISEKNIRMYDQYLERLK
jgi:MoaA/NifB/PqqE/SkfB family radical SAM enzyme